MPAKGIGPAVGSGLDMLGPDDLTPDPDVDQSALISALNWHWWGGISPPAPVQIPVSWITGAAPVAVRQSPGIPRAEVGQSGAGTAVSTGATTAGATFRTTLGSVEAADASNLARWVTDWYTGPQPRVAALTLTLTGRSPVELWRILGVTQGQHIQITGVPGEPAQLVDNFHFESGIAGWVGSGATPAQSSTFAARGNFSMRLTPDGVSANVFAENKVEVVPGGAYTAAGWLFSLLGWSSVSVSVNWYDSTGTGYISTSSTDAAIQAGASQYRTAAYTAPANARYGGLHPVAHSTPTSGDLLYADEMTLTGPSPGQQWPSGATHLIVEGITHRIVGDVRQVTWNTTPIVGAVPGVAGPWFRYGSSRWDGTDTRAF